MGLVGFCGFWMLSTMARMGLKVRCAFWLALYRRCGCSGAVGASVVCMVPSVSSRWSQQEMGGCEADVGIFAGRKPNFNRGETPVRQKGGVEKGRRRELVEKRQNAFME